MPLTNSGCQTQANPLAQAFERTILMISAKPRGVILAGGLSRRMQGRTKALLNLNGLPLIQHVIDRLSPQVSDLILSVETYANEFDQFGLPQLADPRSGSQGPLGGLLAALESIDKDEPWLLLAPCDAPFIPHDLGQRLMQFAFENEFPVCVIRYETELQPTFSLWHKSLLPQLRTAVLQDNMGGFKQFLKQLEVGVFDWASEETSPFFNINTAGQLERAAALLTGAAGKPPTR
jgi:molybdopterin-guanine dinucleotide biosynthesis protein A